MLGPCGFGIIVLQTSPSQMPTVSLDWDAVEPFQKLHFPVEPFQKLQKYCTSVVTENISIVFGI